jgi:hypothetical protein
MCVWIIEALTFEDKDTWRMEYQSANFITIPTLNGLRCNPAIPSDRKPLTAHIMARPSILNYFWFSLYYLSR